MNTKYVTIFFDYEGEWGMPFKADYNLKMTTDKMLKLLKKYNIKAVFNTCGIIIEKYPDLVKKIDKAGHEIAIHGYKHEDLNKVNVHEFNQVMDTIEGKLWKITGKKPVGFRGPYAMKPKFDNKQIYKLFQNRGYKWASNREIRYIEETVRPDRLKKHLISKIILHVKANKKGLLRDFFEIVLNYKFILNDNVKDIPFKGLNKYIANTNWLIKHQTPFYRDTLLEIPILSPFDCDFLELPDPNSKSDQELIEHMYNSLELQLNRSNIFFNVNFHDWIMGTDNRLKLFENILKNLSEKKNIKIILAKDIVNMNNNYE